jgi:hypothetical protein
LTSAQLTLSSVIAFEYPARLDGEVERGEEGELKSQFQVVIVLGTVWVVSLGENWGKGGGGWDGMTNGRIQRPFACYRTASLRNWRLKSRDTYKHTSKKITKSQTAILKITERKRKQEQKTWRKRGGRHSSKPSSRT